MCKQTYTTCRNTKCEGISQMRELHPCDNKPNCKTEFILVKRSKQSTVVYCPDCREITPRQRRGQLSKAWHAADAASRKGGSTKAQGRSKQASTKAQARSKRANTKAQGGNADDSADGGVEKKEAGPSTIGSRGHFDGNFISESNDYFTPLEETEERVLHPEEDSSMSSKLVTISQNQPGTSEEAPSESNHYFTPLEETEERVLRPEEDSSMSSKLVTIFQNQPGTSEEAPSKNSYPVVTHGLQGTNSDAISLDSNDAPRSVAREGLLYGNPADMRSFVPTTTSQSPPHPLPSSQIPIDPVLLGIDAANPRGEFYQEHARS